MVFKLSNIIDQERASQHFSFEEPFSGLSVILVSNFYQFLHVASGMSCLLHPCNHTEDSTLAIITYSNFMSQSSSTDNTGTILYSFFKSPMNLAQKSPEQLGMRLVFAHFRLRT